MKLIDIVNKETDKLNYETLVELRTIVNLPDEGEMDIFAGVFSVNKAGEINSIDGDSYSPDMEICKYEIWQNEDGVNCIDCYYESSWISG